MTKKIVTMIIAITANLSVTTILPLSHSVMLNALTPAQINTQDDELPTKDVQRFVTTIALIHHYYIKNVSNKKLFSDAISDMIASLDPHSSYLNANDLKELKTTVSGEFVGVGIELTVSKDGFLKVISPLDNSPAAHTGIKPNDYIIKINHQLVQNMSLLEAVNRIKGKKDTIVKLTVLRKGIGKPLIFNIKREPLHLISVKSKMLEPGYGYVRITFFQGPVEKQLRTAIDQLKKEADGHLNGLVLDLRNNPGGLLDASAKVVDNFLDADKTHKYHNDIVYTKGRVPSADVHIKASGNDMIPKTPIVVLINGGSASASEIVAGALQDYKRAIIMGTPSFGKGSVQTVLPISNDEAIKLTTALYYTPAGREIQAKGIIPNVTVPELKVKPAELSSTFDEANFQNHLLNDMLPKNNETKSAEEKYLLHTQLQLAKTDYQLYEALLMLQGLNAHVKTS
ncbi:S41 family peptidase [Coxiella endosymbiont of Amblyomma nuttalli]|uniref:S41 family peptidase n=1 Tax=Coxiella endosymbiont of Amblyomma nuttalli TaxID=2749996 RepID=UPI001BAB8448